MNQQQKKYALERVEDICRDKLTKLRDSLTTEAVVFSPEKRLKLFTKGKFKINSSMGNPFEDSYIRLKDAVVFDGETKAQFDSYKYEKESLRITNEADKIRDTIMLGCSDETLKMIENFKQSK